MKIKRSFSAILSGVVLMSNVTALAGCNSSKETNKPDSGNKTVLEVLTNRTDRVDDGSLDELTKAFEEANNCDVQYIGYQDYTGTVATRMGTDDYGDVLMIKSR